MVNIHNNITISHHRTTMPAVLIESEFLSNPDQLVFLNDNNNQQQLAQAIAGEIL